MEAIWSRPLWKDHHDNRVTGLLLSGDRRAGAVRAMDTVRNSRRVGTRSGRGPHVDCSCTRDSPPVSPSVMPRLKMSQVNLRDAVLAPHSGSSASKRASGFPR